MKHVVVVGGGFAGLESAIQLRQRGFQVTLVSDRDYLFIYPISIWIPISEITWEDACQPLAPLAEHHGFELVVSALKGFDFDQRRLTLADRELDYDVLVLAFGASKMLPPGTVEHTVTTCGDPRGSLKIKERLEALVARAEADREAGESKRYRIAGGFGGNPKDKSAVRGGPMFEVLANVRHYLAQRKLLDRFQLDFFAPMPEPGKKMGPDAPAKLKAWLGGLGVSWNAGVPIKGFDANGVMFKDGSRLDSDLTIYIPAGKGYPLVQDVGLPLSEAGFIKIDDHCKVDGMDDVYAAGDIAALEGPKWKAKQGHLAEAMGKVIAHNLAMLEAGTPDKQKGYQEHIAILCVMDTGDGATFVYRNTSRAVMVPAWRPGHWAKQAWGRYWKASKMGSIPRFPGM